MSHSTSLQHLLKHPFCVKLDSETYQINPPAEDFKRALGNVEVEELTQQVYYQKIKQRLLSQKRSFILYSYACFFFPSALLWFVHFRLFCFSLELFCICVGFCLSSICLKF
jgi:hypothetical protein